MHVEGKNLVYTAQRKYPDINFPRLIQILGHSSFLQRSLLAIICFLRVFCVPSLSPSMGLQDLNFCCSACSLFLRCISCTPNFSLVSYSFKVYVLLWMSFIRPYLLSHTYMCCCLGFTALSMSIFIFRQTVHNLTPGNLARAERHKWSLI